VPSRRFTALDGLRGLAALVVLIHHALLIIPNLADSYRPGAQLSREAPDWTWWVTYTPAHGLWAGTEAVYLFFVLSGFVLALPALEGRISWLSYYARRAVRLYLPSWAAILFAALLALLIPRVAQDSQSWWIAVHQHGIEPQALPRLALTLSGNWLNSPLWSLRWEVLFSILLPLYIVLLLVVRRTWLIVLVVLMASTQAGTLIGSDVLNYMPMFGVGVLMAVQRPMLSRWSDAMRGWHWTLLGVSSWLLLGVEWLPVDLPAAHSMAVLGAALMVFLFLGNRGCRRLGDAGPVQWLGRRSFSLYLVHEPIVVSLGVMLSDSPAHRALAIAIALPASLIAADVFFRIVEGPAHQLSGATGRMAERLMPGLSQRANQQFGALGVPSRDDSR
jgi:peptidoglycan/LPS O-acetylase OafA/YrhL